jgi:hypothetical protein
MWCAITPNRGETKPQGEPGSSDHSHGNSFSPPFVSSLDLGAATCHANFLVRVPPIVLSHHLRLEAPRAYLSLKTQLQGHSKLGERRDPGSLAKLRAALCIGKFRSNENP